MSTQNLHEQLALGLAGRGLPLDYAERTASELADHHHDLVEELTSNGLDTQAATAEATYRLGDQKTIIKKAVREYQRRHWCGRWPLLTFLIGPIVLLVVSWVLTILFLIGIGKVCQTLPINLEFDSLSASIRYLVILVFKAGFVFLTPVLVALFLIRKALQAAMGWGWIALATVMLSWAVGTTDFDLGPIPTTDAIATQTLGDSQAQNQLKISAPLMAPFLTSFDNLMTWYTSDYWQLVQLLLPLLVTGIYFCRSQLHQPYSIQI